jgi:hypothetical protein
MPVAIKKPTDAKLYEDAFSDREATDIQAGKYVFGDLNGDLCRQPFLVLDDGSLQEIGDEY